MPAWLWLIPDPEPAIAPQCSGLSKLLNLLPPFHHLHEDGVGASQSS